MSEHDERVVLKAESLRVRAHIVELGVSAFFKSKDEYVDLSDLTQVREVLDIAGEWRSESAKLLNDLERKGGKRGIH